MVTIKEEQPIKEDYDFYHHPAAPETKEYLAFTVSYLPSYRDWLIKDVMKEAASYEDSPEVQTATFKALRGKFNQCPMEYLTDSPHGRDKLFEIVIWFREGYNDCLNRHGLTNPAQRGIKELQIKV